MSVLLGEQRIVCVAAPFRCDSNANQRLQQLGSTFYALHLCFSTAANFNV